MTKKKFGKIADALAPAVEETASIHRTPEKIKDAKGEGEGSRPPKSTKPKPEPVVEETIASFPLKMRVSLRDQLSQLAAMQGMTMRGFTLQALKKAGLSVSDEDLIDRRKRTG